MNRVVGILINFHAMQECVAKILPYISINTHETDCPGLRIINVHVSIKSLSWGMERNSHRFYLKEIFVIKYYLGSCAVFISTTLPEYSHTTVKERTPFKDHKTTCVCVHRLVDDCWGGLRTTRLSTSMTSKATV